MGWIIAGKLDEPDLEATERARDEVESWLSKSFPAFEWKMPLVRREEAVMTRRVESIELLDYGVTERNLRHWDFTLVVTSADLVSHYKGDAWSVVSRSLQGAVISTARIDPIAYQASISLDERTQLMTLRLRSLVIHVLGRLVGLEHADQVTSFLTAFETVDELDATYQLGTDQATRFERGLWEVADRRLEEETDVGRAWAPRFYAHAAWINLRPIAKAIWQARPWQFPFRLSRLTTAAASAMFVLLITAEVWELGNSQSNSILGGLAAAAIVLTISYVVVRQRLFVRRERSRLSEVSVVTNISTWAIVLAGMTTTFTLLAGVTFLLGALLFGPALVAGWVPSTDIKNIWWIYGKLAVFVASIGMFLGALGATFESNPYFRHITFVDEEI